MINVAIATDMHYLPWTATLVRSLIDVHATGLSITLLQEGDIAAQDMDLLATMASNGAQIDWRIVGDPRLASLPSRRRFGGRAALLRLFLPQLLSGVKKIVYLDADTFVVQPLDALWSSDLGENPVAAVANVLEPDQREYVRSLGIEDGDFFNSGVLLIDLDRVRTEDSFEAVLDVLGRRTDALWPDQEALNAVFSGRWYRLHPRWNSMNSLWTWRTWAEQTFGRGAVQEATSSPMILHFEGPTISKPWHAVSTHPWRHAYRETLRRTPWRTAPLEDDSLLTRLLGYLPERSRVPVYWRLRGARRLREQERE